MDKAHGMVSSIMLDPTSVPIPSTIIDGFVVAANPAKRTIQPSGTAPNIGKRIVETISF